MRALRVSIVMLARRMRTGIRRRRVRLARRVSIRFVVRHRVRPVSRVERIWTAIRGRYVRFVRLAFTRALDRWSAVSVVGT